MPSDPEEEDSEENEDFDDLDDYYRELGIDPSEMRPSTSKKVKVYETKEKRETNE